MSEQEAYPKPWLVGRVAVNPETGEIHACGDQGTEIRWWLLDKFGSGSDSVTARRLLSRLRVIKGGATEMSDSESKIKRPMDDNLQAKVPTEAEAKDGADATTSADAGTDQEEDN